MARLGVQPRKMGTTSAPHRSHRSADFPVVLVLHSFLVLRQHPVQSPRVRRFTRVPYFTVHPGVFSACTHASVKLAEALAWDRSMCSVVLRATIEKRRDIRRWGRKMRGSTYCGSQRSCVPGHHACYLGEAATVSAFASCLAAEPPGNEFRLDRWADRSGNRDIRRCPYA